MSPRALPAVPTLLVLLLLPAIAAAGDIEVDGTFVSTVPAGSPPLEVTSNTHVPNLNADLLDGVDVTALLPAMSNVVLVSGSGGHFTSIQAALDSITDAALGNPYLVLVGPGIFTERVVMKPHVDIQGSGRTATTISWSGGGAGNEAVLGSSSAELRNLAVVQNGGGSNDAWAIHNVGTGTSIRDVTVRSISTGVDAVAIRNSSGASPRLHGVSAHAASEGARAIHSFGGLPSLVDVQASVFGVNATAIDNDGASPTMHRVSAIATSSLDNTGTVIGISFSGGVSRLEDVESSVSRGDNIRAIYASSATVTLDRLTARAGGNPGDGCTGVWAVASDLTLLGSDVQASECATTNQGVRSDHSDVQIYNSRISALSGTAYGIYNTDSTGMSPCTVRVNNSAVTGGTNSVSTVGACTTRIGATLLAGVPHPLGAGTLCAGVYDDATNFHAAACPP